MILAIDIALSSLASLCSLFFIGALTDMDQGSDIFIFSWLGLALTSSIIFFLLFKSHRAVVRYGTLRDMGRISAALIGKSLTLLLYSCIWGSSIKLHIGGIMLDFLSSLALLMAIRFCVMIAYQALEKRQIAGTHRPSILIYGFGSASSELALYLNRSGTYNVIGLLTDDDTTISEIVGFRVFCIQSKEQLINIKDKYGVTSVLFVNQEELTRQKEKTLPLLLDAKLKVLIHSSAQDVTGAPLRKGINVRDIKIEDLLGRSEIKISLERIAQDFSGKTVLVTGGAGSIGSELCNQIATLGVEKIIIFDNAETPVYLVKRTLEQRYPHIHFDFVIGDVRLAARLDYIFETYRPHIVFHAAAYKHVPLMEDNPCEAVFVNTIGSKNVADKCVKYGVERMIMVSTDKAVNPTNIMGCTKRLAEIYVQSLGLALEQGQIQGNTKFITTRFGNVLGSNGSVIPLFREQIEAGGPLTVTHPEITRFFMTIPEACRLVMEAAHLSSGNQIFVFDMGESVKIVDLARRMIELAGFEVDKDIHIQFTGLRPGEKLYEEVLSDEEKTLPTAHSRIRIAKVRSYDYSRALEVVEQLDRLARNIEIDKMVSLMKVIVPEYISQNSKFESLDKHK